jgi:hypothetical protein
MASSTIAQGQERTLPWRLIFRIVRWGSYASALVVLLLVLRKSPPPMVETNPQAAARVEEKFEQVQQAVSAGQPATVRMDQTELNSYLISHLDIASNAAANEAAARSTPSATSGPATEGGAAALPTPSGTTAEQVEQVKSAVKDVKVELIDDRARAYVVFDFHGKDMTLQLEGKLGADNGYLQFVPVSGQIGSLPIPQSTLETAVRRLMESPENREKLKLPDGMSSLKIENGEVVASYK